MPAGKLDLDDPRAYAEAYDLYAADVYRVAYAVVRDRDAAEDVVHDVFLRLWRRPGAYDQSRGDLGAYLRLMARSQAVDAWRRSASTVRTRDRLEAEVSVAPGSSEDAATIAERSARAAAVRDAVKRLPGPQREAIALAYWGGMTAYEIAGSSGTPLGTVKSRIRLGLARLVTEAAAA